MFRIVILSLLVCASSLRIQASHDDFAQDPWCTGSLNDASGSWVETLSQHEQFTQTFDADDEHTSNNCSALMKQNIEYRRDSKCENREPIGAIKQIMGKSSRILIVGDSVSDQLHLALTNLCKAADDPKSCDIRRLWYDELSSKRTKEETANRNSSMLIEAKRNSKMFIQGRARISNLVNEVIHFLQEDSSGIILFNTGAAHFNIRDVREFGGSDNLLSYALQLKQNQSAMPVLGPWCETCWGASQWGSEEDYAHEVVYLSQLLSSVPSKLMDQRFFVMDTLPQHFQGFGTFEQSSREDGCAEYTAEALNKRLHMWRQDLERTFMSSLPGITYLHVAEPLLSQPHAHASLKDCTHYCQGSAGWAEYVSNVMTSVISKRSQSL